MKIDIGKTLRIGDFIDSKDGRCLLLETTVASSIGATEGLENLTDILQNVNEIFDGIIINPGQAEHQAGYLGGRKRASPIVRVDWTNAFRDKEFFLPFSNIQRCMISNGEDGLKLGASAVIASLLLGFDADFEAYTIKELSHLSRECHPLSIPVMIDIRPIGEKVTPSNYEESIKLGVSFMQELGADVLVIPECTEKTYQMIANWMSIPVLMLLNKRPAQRELEKPLDAGITGFVLKESICAENNYIEKVQEIRSIVHRKKGK